MAIKINVSGVDQETINELLEKAGYARQRRKYHCTIGFIEKSIPMEEAETFGKIITKLLQDYISVSPLHFEVETAVHIFGHVIAFRPTLSSMTQLKEINQWLSEKINEISAGRWGVNEETKNLSYTPHMTLWRTRHPGGRLKKLQGILKSHPSFHLIEASYVLFH
ncbi:MAG: hypothetical protein K2P93_01250 [Alphaproteobacteria bacterium]|nr:hypothetical protein [Alphaproteobacteria bacterium]